ncbi:hypothetical protein ACN47A_33270 [Myxococcus fulvus]|uniref:hypothetical protein n=1 Tax=Myxococcus fulvus TaxID=33 RepID=UPI003B9A3B46
MTAAMGVLVGVGASVLLLNRSQAPVVAPPQSAPLTRTPIEAPQDDSQVLKARVASLEQQLRESRGAPRSAETRAQAVTPPPPSPAPEGATSPPEVSAPLPFPLNTHEAFTPKGFQALVERSMKECGLQMRQEAMDCSEYPCIAWMESRQTHINMAECGPWAEAFGHKTSLVIRNVQGEDGGVRTLVGLMPLPEDASARRVALRRSRERSSDLLDSYPRP